MKENPILFSGAMVRAILDGKKTQTRRVIKWHHPVIVDEIEIHGKWQIWPMYMTEDDLQPLKSPYGMLGDHLWVRETFCTTGTLGWENVYYRATEKLWHGANPKWTPSIFMPRAASRITLEVQRVEVQRLQDISEEEAQAEGTTPYTASAEQLAYKPAFADLWDSINEKRGYGWDANPFVWVIEFKRILPI